MFEGFTAGVNEENSSLFQFIAFYVTTNMIEHLKDDKWALEYPQIIDTNGRQILHEVANYF